MPSCTCHDAAIVSRPTASEDIPHAAADPPPYEYPAVGRHPTVFFTALLHNFVGAGGLQPREQVGDMLWALHLAPWRVTMAPFRAAAVVAVHGHTSHYTVSKQMAACVALS